MRVIVLDGNYWEGALTPQEKITQRRFLEAELKKKTDAPWTWVVNHFPVFSDGKIRGDNKVLIREWGPLLKESSVSLCFGGHDHIMQHVQVEGYKPSFKAWFKPPLAFYNDVTSHIISCHRPSNR